MKDSLFQLLAAFIDVSPLPHVSADNARISTIISAVAGLLGSIAFIIMIVAGFKYVTSRGDPQAIAKAKNTIIYAAVGLVISVSAYTIVAFVISST